MKKKLSEDEINDNLKKIEGWSYTNNKLQKDIELKDFRAVLGVVNEIGDVAEEMNHHPDILIHSYNKLQIFIYTHDVGGITENDFKLAGRINKVSNG